MTQTTSLDFSLGFSTVVSVSESVFWFMMLWESNQISGSSKGDLQTWEQKNGLQKCPDAANALNSTWQEGRLSGELGPGAKVWILTALQKPGC